MVMNHYRTASGRGGMVMNHYDSAFNRHPNPARGCAESVNWNLKGARKMLILCFALIFLAGCGGGHTLVMTAPSTQWSVSTVTVMPMPSSVDVPEEIRLGFESKLTTLLYDANTFHKGAELTLQYRF